MIKVENGYVRSVLKRTGWKQENIEKVIELFKTDRFRDAVLVNSWSSHFPPEDHKCGITVKFPDDHKEEIEF